MPHSTSPRDLQAEIDDILIQQALDPENTIDFNRELEPGEKAEDAIDFGDLSDDDLADDECETLPIERNGPTTESSFEDLPSRTPNQALQECVNYENNEGDGFDDLFGDNGSSQIEDAEDAQRPSVLTSTVAMELSVGGHDGRLFQEHSSSRRDLPLPKVPAPQDPLVFTKPIYQPATSNAQDKAISKEQQLQQDLFAMSAYGLSGVDYLPPPPQNQEELLKSLWPKYERTQVPRFMELLPPKKTPYAKKTPPKRPKSFQPTKLNLDLAKDLEKSFRLPIASSRPNHEVHEQSCVIIDPDFAASEEIGVGPEDMDIDPDSEITKDITWQDLYFVCQDWDGPERELPQSDKPGMNEVEEDKSSAQDYGIRTTNGLDLHQSKVVTQPPQTNISDCSQKRKLCEPKTDPLGTVEILLSSLHDPIHDTFRVAEAVTLDMNDSLLLTQDESHDTNYRHQRAILSLKPSARGSHAKGLNQRYNVSNDEAYDLLKANHQSKVRSTLGTLTVEHSLPAVRLQWPYVCSRFWNLTLSQ
jgi:transcription initiation factor TFIID subunit 1